VTWVYLSTTTSVRLLTFDELCRAVSPHSASFVDTSPTTASVPWWCRLCTQDYGNFVLVELPAYLQRRLQSVLNAAARLVFRLSRYDHVSDALATVHWLRQPMVYHNESTSRWQSWHFVCCMVSLKSFSFSFLMIS